MALTERMNHSTIYLLYIYRLQMIKWSVSKAERWTSAPSEGLSWVQHLDLLTSCFMSLLPVWVRANLSVTWKSPWAETDICRNFIKVIDLTKIENFQWCLLLFFFFLKQTPWSGLEDITFWIWPQVLSFERWFLYKSKMKLANDELKAPQQPYKCRESQKA